MAEEGDAGRPDQGTPERWASGEYGRASNGGSLATGGEKDDSFTPNAVMTKMGSVERFLLSRPYENKIVLVIWS